MAETDPSFIESALPDDAEVPVDSALRAFDDELAFDEQAVQADIDLLVPDEEDIPIGRSWQFDWVTERFVTQGRGPMPTYGDNTLKNWIDKALRNDLGAYDIHPDDYGMDQPYGMIGEPVENMNVTDYETRVESALTFHPQIDSVDNFRYDWNADEEYLAVWFDVLRRGGARITVGVAIGA